MTYEVKLSETLQKAKPSNIIIPISLGGGALSGKKLKSLLTELRALGHKVTVLIADTLNRHNSDDEPGDLARGEKYLQENTQILEGVNILRWNHFIKERKEEFDQKLELIETHSKQDPDFYKKLLKTMKKTQSHKSAIKSLEYLKEEYAVFLMFADYEFLVYTKPITDGLASMYKVFSGQQKPIYEFVRVQSVDASNIIDMGIFKQKRVDTNLPLAVQLVIDQVETILKSSQISIYHKQAFLEMIENMGAITVNKDSHEEKSLATTSSL